MIYPFIELIEAEENPPQDGFDIEPVLLHFEAYVRIIAGIAYDKCRQLRECTTIDREMRDLLDSAVKIQERQPRPPSCNYGPVFKTCLDRYYPLLESWCRDRKCLEILDWLSSEESLHGKGARSILEKRAAAITLGEYWFNILRMLGVLQKAAAGDEILVVLERAAFLIDIYINIRNDRSHAFTPGGKDMLKKLRNWLVSQNDPLFSQEGPKDICTLIAPQKWSKWEEEVTCSSLTNYSLTHAYLPKELLVRQDLVVEQREPGRELEDTLFIRIKTQDHPERYFRISPFFTVQNVEYGLKKAEYGMLLNNTRGGAYRYARIKAEEKRSDVPGERDAFDFDTVDLSNSHCFFVDSVKERTPSKMQPIGSNACLYISRHPEFLRAIDQKKPFTYYQVISAEDKRRIAQLQIQKSGVHLIFVTGHGGLGKTHLVLHLLRTKYNHTYDPRRTDVRFDQILFLSAKQASIRIAYGNIDAGLDHDIEDYASTIRLLSKLLLQEAERKDCADDLERLADALVRNNKRQLIIFDDLDTLDIDEQVKVCWFLDRFKSEDHRILITSRVVPPTVSSIIAQQTIITLRPLDVQQSLEFCQQYVKEGNMQTVGDLVSNAERIRRVANGVPLNLVLVLHRMQHGYNEELLYDQMERQGAESTRFIFQHILNVLEAPAQCTLGVLGRFGKLLDLSALGSGTLRLLLPSLSDSEYERSLKDLEYYALIECSEDEIIYLRVAVNLEGSDEIEIAPDSWSILESVEKECRKWHSAIGDMRQFLEYLLKIAMDWENDGDPVKRKWVNSCANIVLTPSYEESLPEKSRIQWQNLRTEPGRRAIEDLVIRVDNLSKHEPEKERSVKLLLDRYNQVLKVLHKCIPYWEEHHEEIQKAFELCANDLYSLYSNPNIKEDVVSLLDQPYMRLEQCYSEFKTAVHEVVSERCEEVLNILES